MQWIQKVRDSELRYQKEYGNTLQSEVLEQILAILDA
jgi:hypothetical protein